MSNKPETNKERLGVVVDERDPSVKLSEDLAALKWAAFVGVAMVVAGVFLFRATSAPSLADPAYLQCVLMVAGGIVLIVAGLFVAIMSVCAHCEEERDFEIRKTTEENLAKVGGDWSKLDEYGDLIEGAN